MLQQVLFKTMLALMVVSILLSCGIMHNESVKIAADSVETKNSLNTQSYFQKALVLKLEGKVSENWVTKVRPYFENPNYDAILLWIDSPGGGVADSKIVAHKLNFLKEKYDKPLYIFTERLLASGAYWVACIADEIIAAPSASVGSIGVYMVRWDAHKLYQNKGNIPYYIPSDSNKIRGSNALKFTEEERAYWQKMINAIHTQFVNQIWNNRADKFITAYMLHHDIPFTQYHISTLRQGIQEGAYQYLQDIADGSIYNSKSAQRFGVTDKCLYFNEYIAVLRSQGYIIYNSSGTVIKDLFIEPGIEMSKKSFWSW